MGAGGGRSRAPGAVRRGLGTCADGGRGGGYQVLTAGVGCRCDPRPGVPTARGLTKRVGKTTRGSRPELGGRGPPGPELPPTAAGAGERTPGRSVCPAESEHLNSDAETRKLRPGPPPPCCSPAPRASDVVRRRHSGERPPRSPSPRRLLARACALPGPGTRRRARAGQPRAASARRVGFPTCLRVAAGRNPPGSGRRYLTRAAGWLGWVPRAGAVSSSGPEETGSGTKALRPGRGPGRAGRRPLGRS